MPPALASTARRFVHSRWLRLAGTLAGVAMVVRSVDPVSAGRTLGHADVRWLVVGVLLTGIATLTAVGQWGILLHGLGHRLGVRRLAVLHLQGLFVGQLFPAAVGGDAMRVMAVSGETGTGTAVATLTASRMAGSLGMAVWSVAGAIAVRQWLGVPGLLGAFAFAGAMCAAWLVALSADCVVRRCAAGTGRIRSGLRRVLGPFADAFALLRRRPTVVLRCVAVGSLGWGVNLLALSAFARALGMHADWSVFAVAVPVTLVATLSPVSVNGYGVREGVLVGLLAHAGVDASNAGAFSVLVDLQILPFAAIGAALWVRRERTVVSVSSDEPFDDPGLALLPGALTASAPAPMGLLAA